MIRIKTARNLKDWKIIQEIRATVFHQEQGISPELEFDGRDGDAQHLIAYLGKLAVGTCRIRALTSNQVKLERLAVLKSARRQGVGTRLMEDALQIVQQQGFKEVFVNAQTYVQGLYLKLGFEKIGEEFKEVGISHIEMIKDLERSYF